MIILNTGSTEQTSMKKKKIIAIIYKRYANRIEIGSRLFTEDGGFFYM